MAYTYDDFTKAAQNAGMLQRFSQSDLETAKLSPEYGLSLLRLFQDEDGANTAEQKLLAQESANQLRKSYGTSLPASGSGTGTMHTAGSFTYEKDPEYHQLLDRIVNREQFSYDPQTDPQAAAFRKQYLREAERAREDTIAKAAANSGGTPSSFAVTAAQQAGDYYVGQLNDALPTLQQNAYQRYLNEVAADIDALGALSADRNFSYQGYLEQQQRLAEAAELMAAKGDYSLLGQLYGLTDDQIALLGGIKQNAGPGGYVPPESDPPVVADDLLEEMADELQDNQQPEEDTGDYTVTNRTGDGWIAVGNGRMTWTELERAVNQGRILEVVDPKKGTRTYKYPPAGKTEENPNSAGKNGTVSGKGGAGGGKPITAVAYQESLLR